MTTPLDTVTGTLTKINATSLGASPGIGPSNGQVTMSLPLVVDISNNVTCNTLATGDLLLSSSFTNPWPTNPSSNNFCLHNDGSNILTWTQPPQLQQNTWNTTGPDLRFVYSNLTVSAPIANPLV